MRRSAVEVEVVFLQILAVVGLAIGQAEGTFFQDRVLAIPQGQTKAQQLVVIADAGKTIFAPVIGTGPGHVVSEVVPRIAVVAIVFTHRSPLPLAKTGSPFPPWCFGDA